MCLSWSKAGHILVNIDRGTKLLIKRDVDVVFTWVMFVHK